MVEAWLEGKQSTPPTHTHTHAHTRKREQLLSQHNRKYKKFLKKYKSQMTEKEFDYLQNLEAKTSNLTDYQTYIKSKQINEKCKLTKSGYVEITEKVHDLKLRPTVAGPSCHTHRLSNLLDILIRPYTKHVTSYLRDTTDFLNNLPTTVPNDTILASSDIESLYSNIPHDLDIGAVNYWIYKYPDTLHSRFWRNETDTWE